MNAAASPYRPIPCSAHERLELAVLRRQWLTLDVAGAAQRVLPVDVYTQNGAEWLRARDASGASVIFRLDALRLIAIA